MTSWIISKDEYAKVVQSKSCSKDANLWIEEVCKKLNEENNQDKEKEIEGFKFINEDYDALEKFKDKNLLKNIHKELSKTHIGDDKLKMTTFLTATSGLLPNQKRRMSIAITGNSADGKSNLITTTLKHQPDETKIFLTSGTQATIEDDIAKKRQIGFSEVNANRENGSNKYLTEVIKQKTEGGTSALKKDIRTGMKTARHEVGEQASVLFSTTESQMDEEMRTRFIKGTIETDSKRIKKVNENTLDTFADLDKLLKDSEEKDSWIKIGLTAFFQKKRQPEVYIPYAVHLKDQINGKEIFDHSDPRSQRDIKRVLALTCAMTYLFQEQRKTLEHNGKLILVSEPQDFINVLQLSGDFFNQSYSGLDKRLSNVVKLMLESSSEWVARDELQEQMNISRNTIKQYCQVLADEGLIQGISGRELNAGEGSKYNIYDGNKIYYKRCQKGGKKPLIRCEINDLKEYLELKTSQKLTPFDIDAVDFDIDDKKVSEKKVSKLQERCQDDEKDTPNPEIDTFNLTPLEKEIFEEYLSQGMPKEQILDIIKHDRSSK